MIEYWKGITPPLTLKVRCGTQGNGGRGALIQTDQSATLSTFQDQTLFQPICIQGNCIDRALTAGCNGKGWTENVSYTLNTVDRPAVVSLLNDQGGSSISGDDNANVSPTLRAEMHGNIPAVVQNAVVLDSHPNDSRINISDTNVVQTLSGRMGTGGGNTPMVLECYSQDAYDKFTPNDTASTLKREGGSYGGDLRC